MSDTHTPEPWRIGNLASWDGYTGKPFRNVWSGESDSAVVVARAICDKGEGTDVDADARRIVACVNACAGIDTSVIEAFNENGLGEAVLRYVDVKKQRDELLAALRLLVASCDTGMRGRDGKHCGTKMPELYAVQAGHDAIASVKPAKCETCNGHGMIGGHVGQTPESFDYVSEPCPDCVKGGEA